MLLHLALFHCSLWLGNIPLYVCTSSSLYIHLSMNIWTFQGKPFNNTVIQVYVPTNNAEEAVIEQFYDLLELTRPSGTNTPKWCPFHYRGLKCKSRKSRNTWSNGQIWPWSTEWSREKANRVLPREGTGHSKHPLPTTREKTLHKDITRWSIPKSD